MSPDTWMWLPHASVRAPGAERSPVWSPDGKRIAFTSERDGNAEIYVMGSDGSQQTRLTGGQP